MGERWTPAYDRLFDPDHELRGEPVCQAFAWLDLCHMARWEEGQRIIGGQVVRLARGELVASYRFLAERWMWSVKRVRTFLDVLTDPEVQKLRQVRGTPVGTVYRIASYATYAIGGHSGGHGQDRGGGTGKGTGYAQEPQGFTDGGGTGGGTGGAQVGHKEQSVTETTPPTSAREGGRLREWLGESSTVVGRFVAAHTQNELALESIYEAYAVPSMVGEQIWGKTPKEAWPAIVADSMEAFAAEGKQYQAHLFRAFVETRVARFGRGQAPTKPESRRSGGRPKKGGRKGVNAMWEDITEAEANA